MPQPYSFCYRIATFFRISILLSIIFHIFARGNQIDKNMKRILLSLCVLLRYAFSSQAHRLRLQRECAFAMSFIFVLLVALSMSSCQPKVCQIKDKTFHAMISKNNDFTWKLYREASDSTSSIISPISITYLLSMTLNGAEGNTLEEIKTNLGWKDMSPESINSFCYRLMNEETSKRDSVLKISNYIALNKDYSFKHSFVKKARSIYNAQVECLDFSDQTNSTHINDWCKKHTNGMIPSMIDKIEPSVVSYFLNAISFHDEWEKPFEEINTEDKPFYCINRHTKDINMMTDNEAEFPYMEDSLLSAISLPYKGGKYSMVILLPRKNHSLKEVRERLNQHRFQQILQKMKTEKNINLWIPKFTIDKQTPLKQILSQMGFGSLFNSQTANFQKLANQNIYVSDMRQRARIEVTEQGTKAAAVTLFEYAELGLLVPQHQKTFHADHPFIYVIRNNMNRTLLFIGQYTGI